MSLQRERDAQFILKILCPNTKNVRRRIIPRCWEIHFKHNSETGDSNIHVMAPLTSGDARRTRADGGRRRKEDSRKVMTRVVGRSTREGWRSGHPIT